MDAGTENLKSTALPVTDPGGLVSTVPLAVLPQAMPALRAEDFLSLAFTFFNLTVSTPSKGQQVLSPTDPKVPSYIVATFPPQHIAEQAYFETAAGYAVVVGSKNDHDTTTKTDPIQGLSKMRLAGLSRLVFQVPAGAAPIPLTLADLLDRCSVLAPSIAKAAFGPSYIEVINIGTTTSPAGIQPLGAAKNLIMATRVSHPHSAIVSRSIPPAEAATSQVVGGVPTLPATAETLIELPYGLIISPNQYGAWAHATTPVRSKATQRTELWHTRLGARSRPGAPIGEGDDTSYLRNITALLALQHDPTWKPIRSSLSWDDPSTLAKQSTAQPGRIEARRLMLSSLGGWLDVHGHWGSAEIEDWRHIAAMGRDQYVRVVYAGYAFPFGHSISLVKVTERKFQGDLPHNPACLRQRMYIVVNEAEKDFGAFPNVLTPVEPGKPAGRYDLQFPFRRVRITTLVTPDLDPPTDSKTPAWMKDVFFVPRVGGEFFRFHIIAEDIDGREVEFHLPLGFIDRDTDTPPASSKLKAPGPIGPMRDFYEDARNQLASCDLGIQRVTFAPGTDSDPAKSNDIKPGGTLLDTQSITFGGELLDDGQAKTLKSTCHFYPAVRGAAVVIPAVKHLTGDNTPVKVRIADVYRKNGFQGANAQGQVFLETVEAKVVNFNKNGGRSGALISPNMNMTGLSRRLGLIGGSAETFAGGRFDPSQFFDPKLLTDCLPLLFGTIPLGEVLKEVTDFTDTSKLPKFLTEGLTAVEDFLQDLALIESLVDKAGPPAKSAAIAVASAVAVASAIASPPDLVAGVKADVEAIIKDFESVVSDPLHADTKALEQAIQKLVGSGDNAGSLQGLLDAVPGMPAAVRRALQQVRTRVNQVLGGLDPFLQALTSDHLTVKFQWSPDIQAWPSGGNPFFEPNANGSSFSIAVTLDVKKSTGEASADVYCGLRDFKLNLIPIGSNPPFVILHFDALEFTASSGKKPDVNVNLAKGDGVTFSGPLTFVQTLRDLIPLDGFSDPPALSVDASGITASYSVAIPSVGVGVFSLENLGLGAGFNVPFIGNPINVSFNFCSRDQPFLLTVSMFGGGGFFGITLDPNGIEKIEAAFEFGAAVSINLGVASGGVHVLAGIYFSYTTENKQNLVHLDGFLRMGGNVEILGLINASIELDLDLVYDSGGGSNSMYGTATITVEVSIAFFSVGVKVSCRKQFAGGSDSGSGGASVAAPPLAAPPLAATSPTFEDLMKPESPNSNPWHDYCGAFAPSQA
jgi:hypothetical protein